MLWVWLLVISVILVIIFLIAYEYYTMTPRWVWGVFLLGVMLMLIAFCAYLMDRQRYYTTMVIGSSSCPATVIEPSCSVQCLPESCAPSLDIPLQGPPIRSNTSGQKHTIFCNSSSLPPPAAHVPCEIATSCD